MTAGGSRRNETGKLEQPRPAKLKFTAIRVAKASRELTSGQKLLLIELHALDSGDERGCWAGSRALAERLGVEPGTVEDVRRELRWAGLLAYREVPRQRTQSWYPVVPLDCIPLSPRPSPTDISVCAGRLDGHIRQARLSVHEGTPSSPSAAPAKGARASTDKSETGVRAPTPEPAKGIPAPTDKGVPQPTQGREGGGASTLPQVGDNPPTSPPPSEVGAVDRPREEVGDGSPLGEDSEGPGRWRQILAETTDALAMDGPRRLRR